MIILSLIKQIAAHFVPSARNDEFDIIVRNEAICQFYALVLVEQIASLHYVSLAMTIES